MFFQLGKKVKANQENQINPSPRHQIHNNKETSGRMVALANEGIRNNKVHDENVLHGIYRSKTEDVASSLITVRMPQRLKFIFVLSLVVEWVFAIGVMVCGITKIKTKSHFSYVSNGMYIAVFAIMAALSGTFRTGAKNSRSKKTYQIHLIFTVISMLGYIAIIILNIFDLQYDSIVRHSKYPDVNPNNAKCERHCLNNGTTTLRCICTYNETAFKFDIGMLLCLAISMIALITSSFIAICAMFALCGARHEDTGFTSIVAAANLKENATTTDKLEEPNKEESQMKELNDDTVALVNEKQETQL